MGTLPTLLVAMQINSRDMSLLRLCSACCSLRLWCWHQEQVQIRWKLFNSRRLDAITKVKETVFRDFLFTDDWALFVNSEQEMQRAINRFSSICDNLNLTISAKETEVMFQPAPGKPYLDPHIWVKDENLQAVENFTYGGSTLSCSADIDVDVSNRVSRVGRMRETAWERRGICLVPKSKCTKQWSCMAVKHGQSTGVMSSGWIISTSPASGNCWGLAGRTRTPTLKGSNKPTSRAS